MYYQNGGYMQDLNYYNQNPAANQGYGYNPYMTTTNNNYQTQNITQGQPMMAMPMQMPQQNLNAMYPAVYRIISPVASQVLSNSNTQYISEDALNNMVDTVYNIVEGDINLSDDSNSSSNLSSNSNTNSRECESNQSNNCGRTSTPNSSSNSTSTTTSRPNRQNSLLRDLIKIILLNEIISRRQNQNSQMMMSNSIPNNMQNMNLNQQMFR